MASFRCDLLKQYMERLINRAITEVRHVFCFTCVVNEFEEERARLEPERIAMRQRVMEARQRDKDVNVVVPIWEEEVDRLNELDTKTKETCFFGFCPNCAWRYKKGKELATSMERIKQLKENANYFENIELPCRLPDVERYSSKNYISFKGRYSIYKELLDALIDENNYIIGLQGMGGTGKTTLVREVGKELKQSKQFSLVIDITVSFTPNISRIQDYIAGPLGENWENCSESERAIKLRRRLTNGEKILLIVDDVWPLWDQTTFNFEAIGIPNRTDHKGCRVLVTTRCKQMLYKMNCDKRIELDLLTEEDAWIMFERYAGISNSSSKHVIGKGREIAKECKQLPIAVAVIASSLKGQQHQEHEWNVTLKSLKNRASIHYANEDMAGIYKCLEYSYYITDEKAQGLFLSCSLFRENEEISIEVLTRFIIGAGFFGDNYSSYDDARSKVVIAKNELLDSYLLLEVGEKHVKMHDLVRAMAHWIAKKKIQEVNLSKANQKFFVERETNIKYLSCEGKDMDLFSVKFAEGANLETLIVKVDRDEDRKCMKLPDSFFENIVKLRVLYFLGKDVRPLSLPHSICLLTNIRSMLVDSVDLGDISILGNLESLETLDLVQCTINEFPREITKLEKLTLLKLEYCEIKRNNPFEVIESCSSLEELYFIDSFNGFCQEINFPELQIYHIRKGRAVMDDTLSKYVVFPSNDDACCFSNAKLLKHCMQTAEVLHLNGIKGAWRNLMPEIVPIDPGMDDLVELCLSCISQLQCLIDTIGNSQVQTVLSKLVVLELTRMENLEELFKGTISSDSMENLEELSIIDCEHLHSLFKCKLNLCNLKTIKLQSCPMLGSLYQLLTSQNLVVLETLEIGDCEKLKNIIADERREEESIQEIDDGGGNLVSMFPKLKVLVIEGCPLLEYIFPHLFVHDLPVLETIKVRRCDELKYIFGQYQDAEFGSLRELELSQLPNFIDMFCKSNHPISLYEKGSSSTSNDGSKAQIQLDPVKCNIFSGDTVTTTIPLFDGDYSGKETGNLEFSREESNSHCLNNKSVGFPKLEVFYIAGCPLLESIFPFLSVQDLPVIETIKIRRCDGLKYIFGQYQPVEFDSLRQLELSELPSFIDMFRKSNYPISLYEKGSSSTFNSDSKAQLQLDLDPMKCSIFSTEAITTTTPLVDGNYSVLELTRMENLEELFKGTISSKSMENLEKLSINDCKHLKSLFKCKLNLFNLKTIKLQSCPMLVSLYQLLTSGNLVVLETLKIGDCEKLKNIIADERREEESIEEIDEGVNNNNCLGSKFPKLKVLDIEGCPLLEYIFAFLFVHDLPVLETIKIRRCGRLKNIFGQYQDAEFGSLRQLELSQLPKFIGMFCKSNHPISLSEKGSSSTANHGSQATTIPLADGHYTESNSHFLNSKFGPVYPQLEVFDIEGCPSLESIFPLLFVQDLPVLQTIKIRRCDGLKHIFGQYQHVEFSSLRQLELSQLPNFIDMFCKSNHPTTSLSEKSSSSTSNYGSKAQLQLDLDPMKFNIFSWDTTTTTIPLFDGHYLESNSYCLNIWKQAHCLQIPSTILYNIKKIELSHFPKIRSVFIPSIASRMLLETLTIRNCDELKNIIDFGDYDSGGSNNWSIVFPKMKELYIEGCPKMDYIFGHKTDNHQIQLQLLELKCLSLCNLPSIVALCPKHYRIRFPPLAKLVHNNCSPAAVKSMRHFIIDPVSESLDRPIIQGVEITVEEGRTSTNANTITSTTHSELVGSSSSRQLVTPECKASSRDDDCDGQITIPSPMAMIEPLATHDVVDDEKWDETNYALKLEMLRRFDYGLQNETDLETTEDFAAEVEVQAKAGQMLQLCLPFQDIEISVEEGITSNYEKTKDGDSQITLPSPPIATIEPLTPPNIDVENSNGSISLNDDAVVKVASTIEEQFPYDDDDEVIVSKSRFSSIGSQFPSKGFQDGTEVQATSEHILTSSHENDIDSSTPGSGTKMKQTAEGDQDFIENVSDLKIASNSEVLMNGQTTSVLGEIDTTITTSQEDGDGKISIPSFSAVNTKPPATKYVDIGDSQKTVAMEDINKLIEEDPLRALATLEKLLTGQVSISSFRVLLQELKTLMDSSSELDHLVSNQESISKLNSPFHRLNQHPGMLTSDMKDFVEKVQNFFNENIIKHTTSQQVLKKHNQLLYSKTDLMNKLWSVKSTQTHIDTETSTTNAQIHLQIDEQRTKLADHENQRDGLKSVLNKFDVQKMKLKAECTELAQQSKKFLSALASSEVDVREAERVRNSANEGFANLKSSFPTF